MQYSVTAPNGKTYDVEGPEGATDAQVQAQVLRHDPRAGEAPGEAPSRGPLDRPTAPGAAAPATNGPLSNLITGQKPAPNQFPPHNILGVEIPDFSLQRALSAGHNLLRSGATGLFDLAGKADVAAGIKTPEQAESRAGTYGGLTANLAEAALVPFSKAAGLPGFLARMGQGAGLTGAQTYAETGDVTEAAKSAGWGAMAQGAGDAAFKGVRALFSAIPKNAFAGKSSNDLAVYLKQNVPAWNKLGDKPADVWEMAHGRGQELLSDAYERGIQSLKGKLPADSVTQIPVEVARKAGIAVLRTPIIPKTVYGPLTPRPAVEPPAMVEVSTRQLIDGVQRLRATPAKALANRELRDQALDALDETLGGLQGKLGESFSNLRRSYQIGKGFQEFADKGGFLANKAYDPVKAQTAMTDWYTTSLGPRGMGRAKEIVEGPLASTPIQRKTMAAPLGAAGGVLGGVAGGSFLPGVGHLGGAVPGAYMGARLGQQIPRYTNVPPMLSPTAAAPSVPILRNLPSVRQMTPAALQALQQQIQRDLRENRPQGQP